MTNTVDIDIDIDNEYGIFTNELTMPPNRGAVSTVSVQLLDSSGRAQRQVNAWPGGHAHRLNVPPPVYRSPKGFGQGQFIGAAQFHKSR